MVISILDYVQFVILGMSFYFLAYIITEAYSNKRIFNILTGKIPFVEIYYLTDEEKVILKRIKRFAIYFLLSGIVFGVLNAFKNL